MTMRCLLLAHRTRVDRLKKQSDFDDFLFRTSSPVFVRWSALALQQHRLIDHIGTFAEKILIVA